MNPKEARQIMIFLLCFVALAALFFGWAAIDFVQEMVFLHNAERVTGTVTDISASTTYQDQQYWTDYCPVITFQTRAGQRVKYDSQVCSDPPDYKVGQQIGMFYDPRNPASSQMQNWMDQYSSTIGPIILGVIFGGIALIILLASIQKDKEIRADKARWGH